MEALKLEKTDNTPEVILDHRQEELRIRGESRPEDTGEFYKPVLEWLENYKNFLYWVGKEQKDDEKTELSIDFEFDYFNSTSAKYIMDIINKIKEINAECPEVNIQVNWHYEKPDEDMLDAGEEFQEMSGLSFNFKPLEV